MIPLHPQLVHLPLALSLILPFLAIVIVTLIQKKVFSKSVWFLLIGLQVLAVTSGYVAMNAGEKDEKVIKQQQIVNPAFISYHENKAEMFVSLEVVALALLLMTCFLKDVNQNIFALASVAALFVGAFMGFKTGQTGGLLVYKYQAARAYLVQNMEQSSQGILPTPGINTSESPFPVEGDEQKIDLHKDH